MSIGIINHNISAINALRNLDTTGNANSKVLQKLSSGMRINSAADDAAGLAVSEKMRSQIYGLDQAERNALDAISMIQVAEGVMDTLHSIMQRMRVLSVQAATDNYTSYDRRRIQNEIDELIDEVDRVAEYTEFNTKKLINGKGMGVIHAEKPRALTGMVVGAVANCDLSVTILDAGTACNIHGDRNLVDVDDPDNLVTLRDAGIFNSAELHLHCGEQATVIDVHEDDSLQDVVRKINLSRSGITAGLDGQGNDLTMTSMRSGSRYNIHFGLDPDGVAVKLGLLGGADRDLTVPETAVDSNGAEIITNGRNHALFTSGTDTIISITNITKQTMFPTSPGRYSVPGGYGQSLGIFKSDCGIFTEKELAHPINEMSIINSVTGQMIDQLPQWPALSGYSDSSVDLTQSVLLKGFNLYVDEAVKNGVLQTTDDDDTDEGADTGWTRYFPDPYFPQDISGDGVSNVGDYHSRDQVDHPATCPESTMLPDPNATSLTTTRVSIRDHRPVFHIGANQSQTMTVGFGNMTAEALGLTVVMRANGNRYNGREVLMDGSKVPDFRLNISLQTRENANNAIGIIDDALAKISEERSALGAAQNSLEKSVHYLGIAGENMTASESRIRDADMAKEMSELVKLQVLTQSGVAMAAQANQRSQAILGLLG